MKPRSGWGEKVKQVGESHRWGNNAITIEAAAHVVKREKPKAGEKCGWKGLSVVTAGWGTGDHL